jgi:hypothetical protein
LQTPRALPGRGGAPVKSQVINVQERMIGTHMWVDGMHLGSEVGPYFTRYLATIKDRIAILVTFSAHKEHYTKYSGDFIKAIESLKVVATKDTLGSHGLADTAAPSGPVGPGTGQVISTIDPLDVPPPNSGKNSAWMNLLLLGVILAAIGGYFYMRAQKKPKSKKPSAPPPPAGKPKKK